MNQSKQCNNDWITLLKFKEIYGLLDFKDLENLSFVCKNVYFKTKPLLISKIHIHSYLLINNLSDKSYWYDNGNVNISNDMLLQYKDSVKSISNHVKSAKVDEIPLYPELHLYLDSFINLERLVFANLETKINLTSLNLILNRSSKLNELTLLSITIHSNEIGDANKILFPSTLTKLSINYCIWPDYYQTLRENSITVPTLGPYSVLSTQKFYRLVHFEYFSSRLFTNFNIIPSILENSPILGTLSLEVSLINREFFDLISRSTSLKSIRLVNREGTNINPEEFSHHLSYPTIAKFNYLFVENQSNLLPNIELLLSRFHNLKILNLSFEIPFLPHIYNILEKLPNLQKLEIFNIDCHEFQLPLNITNRTITSLTIINFKVDQIDFKDFEEWYALKSIKLEFNSFSIKNYNHKWVKDQAKDEVNQNWIIFNCTDNYIRFYRK
ncbi:hypothetical protein CONCODRAFT_86467 [Conidiobolus coronatus NRRL 28638]|uniref:F-box domain-containing protein n=1 Tax=Conidiobolus coronatus (strain ATCC 28846 / CBS 209.66 / NRRL 28638) TaxID=796925 RepID=A0A137P0M0_CONC2|nr:hypothetical protein CONCODRAFT_86467 [Conidiobolus coronatus NRRL 28638]|eukprot:KXN68414.1 hypothetical protein CONCODRAFT_86467 [Conidiobolus coronatus NRRL 28638]